MIDADTDVAPRPRVVVVDDDPSLSFLVRIVLEAAGYEVVQAMNGRAALDRIGRAATDLVVTDLMMPVMGGRALVEHLRADLATAALPILMLSSNPDTSVAADAFLTKPFDPEALLAIVSQLTQAAPPAEGTSR